MKFYDRQSKENSILILEENQRKQYLDFGGKPTREV
jgi:hypothetical protein